MLKLANIISGWGNYLFENKEAEKVANERAEVCARCPHAIEGWYETIKDNRIESISGLVCSGCETKVKCPLSTKLRSLKEKCPKQKW